MSSQPNMLRVQAGMLGHTRGRRRYSAVFVQAGAVRAAGGGPAGLEIRPEALAEAAESGLFNARAVFLDHSDLWQHPSLDNLAGVTRQSYWDGQAVRGEIELYRTPAGRTAAQLLDELLEQGAAAPDVGLSLAFYPDIENDPAGGQRQVVHIQHVESVDLVFEPAAGGRILAMLSAHSHK